MTWVLSTWVLEVTSSFLSLGSFFRSPVSMANFGVGGLASAVQLMEISHTHFWTKDMMDNMEHGLTPSAATTAPCLQGRLALRQQGEPGRVTARIQAARAALAAGRCHRQGFLFWHICQFVPCSPQVPGPGEE